MNPKTFDVIIVGRRAAARRAQQLRATIERLVPALLNRRQPGSKYTALALVQGIAAHDLYHAGQVQLLKRLARS